MDKKTNPAETESKIAVIEDALLKNVIGGAGTRLGEISSRLGGSVGRVECTGK
jgi:hypothetical protein